MIRSDQSIDAPAAARGSAAFPRLRLRGVALACLLAGVALSTTGCFGGSGNFENENDRLRAENLDLTAKVQTLSDRVTGLEKRLQIEERRNQTDLPAGLHRPTAVKVQIGNYSGGVDTDEDDADDAIRLYLVPYDARGRFVQTLANVHVTVVAIPPGEEAQTLVTAGLDAETLNAAYRAGLTGTHYTLTIPVTKPVPPGTDTLTVRIALHDLLTGQTLEAEEAVAWNR